jgi:ParB/RepB/Spo0J family partition protein
MAAKAKSKQRAKASKKVRKKAGGGRRAKAVRAVKAAVRFPLKSKLAQKIEPTAKAAGGVAPEISVDVGKWPIQKIRIADIVISDNGRMKGSESCGDAAIAELAATMRRVGQLQPIGVQKGKGGKYHLLWGGRRTAAARVGNIDTLNAAVAPEGKPVPAEAIRTIENVYRADFNPIEEAVSVAEVVQAVEKRGITGRDAVIAAGVEMGKSETWVRDRMYLSRLTGDTRQLVIDGRLPLLQAREIAKLADPRSRDQLAEWAARAKDGTGGWTIEKVRRHVHDSLNSLRVVPWRLDAPIAGKGPCTTCEFNTANAGALFEHDNKATLELVGADLGEGQAGKCLNAGCFAAKQKASETMIRHAVTKAAKEVNASKGKGREPLAATPAALTGAGLVPAAIKPAVISRETLKETGGGDAKTPGKISEAGKAVGKVPSREAIARDKAEREWFELNRDWARIVEKKIDEAVDGDPLRKAAVCMMIDLKDWPSNHYAEKKSISPRVASMIAKLHKPDLSLFMELGKESKPYRSVLPESDSQHFQPLVMMLAKAFGLLIPAPPKPLKEYIADAVKGIAGGEAEKPVNAKGNGGAKDAKGDEEDDDEGGEE